MTRIEPELWTDRAGAVAAGAHELAAVGEEHGSSVGRVLDPFGYEWEIGRPGDAAAQ